MLPNTVLSPLGCELHDWNMAGRETLDANRRGLILDLDDTLYPREEFVQSGLMAVARAVEDEGARSAMEAFWVMAAERRQQPGRELQALCAHLGWDESHVIRMLAVYRSHVPRLRLPRESAEVMRRLRGDGWRIAVLTNGLPQVQRIKVAALGLRSLVDAVLYAEEHSSGGKPAAAAFRAAVNALGVAASRCVCAGDDAVCDVAGAQALGMRTVWVTPGFGIGAGMVRLKADPTTTVRSRMVRLRSDPTSDATPDAQIASIADLPTVLAELLEMVGSDAA
jgi:putative hydrolase of the HAD superfamily